MNKYYLQKLDINKFPTLELGIEQIIDEENYVLHTVWEIVSIKKNEEILPIIKVDDGQKMWLPRELWSWGNELVKKKIGNRIEVKFIYSEEYDVWSAEIVHFDCIVTHCASCYYYPIGFDYLKEGIDRKWNNPHFCKKCEQKTTEEKIEVLKKNLKEYWYRKEEIERDIKRLEKIQQHENR